VLPLGLVILQTLIFVLGGAIFGLGPDDHASPPLGATLFIALHGVNGAAILLTSFVLVGRARKLVRQGPATSADATSADATAADATAGPASGEPDSVDAESTH
jgi:hypothetical protein